MKKSIALLLSVVFIMTSVPLVFAHTTSRVFMLGDVDMNDIVTASDARSILRHSARLDDYFNGTQLIIADANGDKLIHADDARMTLRVSARLEPAQYVEIRDPEEPASEEPASKEPVSTEPISEEPASEEPISEEPVSEEPASEEPASDDPQPDPSAAYSSASDALSDVGAKLLQEARKNDRNAVISPLSIYIAMSMLANGSDGNTLQQIENALGMTAPELNAFILTYLNSIEEDNELKLANSAWVRNASNLQIKEEYVNTCKRIFDADVFIEPFDQSTADKINAWTKEKTDDMISRLLDDVADDAVVYLINALSFISEWGYGFDKDMTSQGVFNGVMKNPQTAQYMSNHESWYINAAGLVGFKKYYKNTRYSFIAFMSETDPAHAPLDDALASALAAGLKDVISSASPKDIDLRFPKFETEFSCSLPPVLNAFGVNDVFDADLADLSAMGTMEGSNLFVSSAVHKTFVSVNEVGTKAAAVTELTIAAGSTIPNEIISLTFDCPFIYVIWDEECELPLFIGTIENMNS